MVNGNGRDIVLIVDDSPETVRMLTDALEEAGMTVLVALEGVQALALVERIVPDVILMDAVMPGMDGFEACRRLKRIEAVSHVPVIFMTGLSETDDIVRGLDAGGVDYITKPIVIDELLARIRVHLANARLARSARAALDASGRFLLATNRDGRMLWCTPQAARLLAAAVPGFDAEQFVLPAPVRDWLAARIPGGPDATGEIMTLGLSLPVLRLSFVGQTGADEFLLRLVEGDGPTDEVTLRDRLSLTLREAEVLKWIARGKSNKDIGEILSLSPRTVNKHLEQIFVKLGVENRTAAAALAIRALGER
jgi:DNA-binding NarL/FixJ family response regulator